MSSARKKVGRERRMAKGGTSDGQAQMQKAGDSIELASERAAEIWTKLPKEEKWPQADEG
jgi:hypothetical protein